SAALQAVLRVAASAAGEKPRLVNCPVRPLRRRGERMPRPGGREPTGGLEPPTFRLQVECAANCATSADLYHTLVRGTPWTLAAIPSPTRLGGLAGTPGLLFHSDRPARSCRWKDVHRHG